MESNLEYFSAQQHTNYTRPLGRSPKNLFRQDSGKNKKVKHQASAQLKQAMEDAKKRREKGDPPFSKVELAGLLRKGLKVRIDGCSVRLRPPKLAKTSQ